MLLSVLHFTMGWCEVELGRQTGGDFATYFAVSLL